MNLTTEIQQFQDETREGWMPEKRVNTAAEIQAMRGVISACMSAMPVGNIQTHTPENLPARIGDLAAALATETSENEAMREAIKEAWIAIQYAEARFAGWALRLAPNDPDTDSVLQKTGEASAKLKPFLP